MRIGGLLRSLAPNAAAARCRQLAPVVVVSTGGAEGEDIWIDLGESCFPVDIGESSLSAETLWRIEGGCPACGLIDERFGRYG